MGVGLFQVDVQLIDVGGIRVEAAGGSDSPLHLNEGVECDDVNGLGRSAGGRMFLVNLVGLDESRDQEEVADGARDVRLRLMEIVPAEQLGGGLPVARVVYVQVCSHGFLAYVRALEAEGG